MKQYKIFLRILLYRIELFIPFVRYSKFARDRNYLTSDERYGMYSSEDKFANIGAGPHFYHPRWTNFDFYKNGESYINKNFYPINLVNIDKLPGEFHLVYCSHVVEHIPSTSINKFIKMIKLSMVKNSCIRIITPDSDLIYDAYKRKDFNFFWILKSKIPKNLPKDWEIEFLFLYLIATRKALSIISASYVELMRNNFTKMNKEDFLDFIIDGVEKNIEDGSDHVNWYNFEKLKNLLLGNGFTVVRKSAYGQSFYAPMQEVPLFDGLLPRISLYVEAE